MSDDILTGWELFAQLSSERDEPLFSLSVSSVHSVEVLDLQYEIYLLIALVVATLKGNKPHNPHRYRPDCTVSPKLPLYWQ